MNIPQIPEIASIKIIFTLFALFAWSRAVIRFRMRLLNLKELVFWSCLWLGLTVIVFIPGKTDLLAKILGMNRGLDAMFFLATVALFYSSYRLYAKSSEHQRTLTELVRQIALSHGVTCGGQRKKKVTTK